MQKNEIIELEITDIGVNGEGIGRHEGCTFFVKNAVIGDSVRAVITRMKKEYGYAKMVEVLKPSPCRIEAPCDKAKRCGGCQIMEMNYAEQLAFKERKVRMNLERIGGFADLPLLPIIGMENGLTGKKDHVPLRYRNKMQFPIGRDSNGELAAGFYAGRTHFIIDTDDCPAAPEACSRILKAVKDFIREYKISVYNEITGQGLIRHLLVRLGFRTGEVLVCLVLNGESLNENFYTQNVDTDRLFVDKMLKVPLNAGRNDEGNVNFHIAGVCLNTNRKQTNVILGENSRCLYGRDHIFDEIWVRETGERLSFKISLRSFYQVNPVQTETLYAKALEFAGLTGKETVYDLYCGTGTISLFLAKKAKKVVGVEIVPEAIRDAKENAGRNGIENTEFLCGKSEEIFPERQEMVLCSRNQTEDGKEEGRKPSEFSETVVVLDPPRKGCDKALLDAIRKAGPGRIVYVSCDSATLARDLKILTGRAAPHPSEEEAGSRSSYVINKIQPVDMFPNSVHVETCVLLVRESTCDDEMVSIKGD